MSTRPKVFSAMFLQCLCAATLACFVVTACEGTDPVNPNELTEEEQQEIIRADETITATADSILLLDDPAEAYGLMLPSYIDVPGVEDAWLTEEALFVKYDHGGIVGWQIPVDPVVPAWAPPGLASSTTRPMQRLERPMLLAPIGNSKALLMNQVSEDDRFGLVGRLTDQLAASLTASGFSVTTLNNPDIDLGVLRNNLSSYGLVFFTTHGSFDPRFRVHWVLTGQRAGLLDVISDNLLFWQDRRVSIIRVRELRGTSRLSRRYYAISDRFVDHSYQPGAFPNSLVYFNACQIFKGNDGMGQAFNSKGAGVVLGWTDSQCSGHFTGKMLVDAMLSGLDLARALGGLPVQSTVDFCAEPAGASLTYYPSSGSSLELVAGPIASASIQLESPTPGSSYYTSLLRLSGRLVGAESIDYGTVEINNLTSSLLASGLEFSQPISLSFGANRVRVSAYGGLADGHRAFATTGEFNLNFEGIIASSGSARVLGSFPPSDLYVVQPSDTGDDVLLGRVRTATGFEPVITDIAVKPDGQVYAVSFDMLYLIDPPSLAVPLNLEGLGVGGANALTSDETGKLLGATQAGAFFEIDDQARAVVIGHYGSGFESWGDVVFSAEGQLYGTVRDANGTGFLVLVDRSTGRATPVDPDSPIGFDNVWGLQFVGHQLHGLTSEFGTQTGKLIKINTTTGVGELVRELSFDAFGGGVTEGVPVSTQLHVQTP